MKYEKTSQHVTDLIFLLENMRAMQTRLLRVVQDKLDAMKCGDTTAMQGLDDNEKQLLTEVGRIESERRKLVLELATGFDGKPEAHRRWTITELASHLPAALESRRTALLAAAERLREVVHAVNQTVRVAALAARETMNHLQWIFASIVPAGDQPATYSRQGFTLRASDPRLIETIG